MATIDSFVISLGFKYDPKGLDQFKKGLNNAVSVVKKLTTAVVGATAAIVGFTAVSTAATDEQGKLAAEIGVAVENIDAYEKAASLAGDTNSSIASSFRGLSRRISEAARGMGEGVEAFGLLGISATDANGNLKDTTKVFGEVAKQFEGLSKARQIELSEKLGLSASIRLLQTGQSNIASTISGLKELGVTTAEDAKIAADFQDSLVLILGIFKDISRVIVKFIAPQLLKLNKAMTAWWKTNRRLFKQNLPKWLEQIGKGVRLLTVAFGGLLVVGAVVWVGKMVSAFLSLSTIVAAFNKLVLFLPGALIGLFAAVLLLAQDAKVFFEGGDSFIGSMLEKFPKLRAQILLAASAFATVWDLVKQIVDGWKLLIDVIQKTDLESTKQFFRDLKVIAVEGFKEIGKTYVEAVKQNIVDSFTTIKNGWTAVIDFVNETTSTKTPTFLEDLKAIGQRVLIDIRVFMNQLVPVLRDVISRIKQSIAELFSPFKREIDSVVNPVENLIAEFKLLDSAIDFVAKTWLRFTEDVKAVAGVFIDIINSVLIGFQHIADTIQALPTLTVQQFFMDMKAVARQAVEDIKNSIGVLGDSLHGFVNSVAALFDSLALKFDEFLAAFLNIDLSQAIQTFVDFKDRIIQEFSGLGDFLKNLIPDSIKAGIDKLKSFSPVDKLKNLFGADTPQQVTIISENISRAGALPATGTTPAPFPGFNPAGVFGVPAGGQTTNNTRSQNVTTGPITINIEGAGDPEEVANTVMEKMLKQTSIDLITPVHQ